MYVSVFVCVFENKMYKCMYVSIWIDIMIFLKPLSQFVFFLSMSEVHNKQQKKKLAFASLCMQKLAYIFILMSIGNYFCVISVLTSIALGYYLLEVFSQRLFFLLLFCNFYLLFNFFHDYLLSCCCFVFWLQE